MIEKLKAKYDGKKIGLLEGKIDGIIERTRKTKIEQVHLLYYLQRTSRFRENPAYKTSSFFQYIEDRFNIRQGTYEKERKAVFGEPERCHKYGVGLVTKVYEKTVSPEKVFKEINGIQANKKRPVPREKIEKIIQKHRKPIPLKPIIPRICQQCEKYKVEIRDLVKENNELKEQIARLKATVNQRDIIVGQVREAVAVMQ